MLQRRIHAAKRRCARRHGRRLLHGDRAVGNRDGGALAHGVQRQKNVPAVKADAALAAARRQEIAAAGQPRGFVLLTAAGGMGLYFAALSETVLEAIMRLLQALAKLRRAIYGLRMHCQTVVKQRCSPVKIRFLTKKFEKDSFLFRKKGIK